jgi:hypothetical protein
MPVETSARHALRRGLILGLGVGLLLGCGPTALPPDQGTAEQFLEAYVGREFALFPTRAVEAGRLDFADSLEDLSGSRLAEWIEFNHRALERIGDFEAEPTLTRDQRLDLELVERHARLVLFDLVELERPRTDPLFWTRTIGNSTVFLLVREDAPLAERLGHAASRARQLPTLALQAEEALAGSASEVAPEVAEIAAGQVAASARFYGEGFAAAAAGQSDALQEELRAAGKEAQAGLDRLARFLETLAAESLGSPRLGAHYEELFHLATGESAGIDEVLDRALSALAAKRLETAAYGRQVWDELMAGAPLPDDDDELIKRLFRSIGDDHAATVDEFVADYETLLALAVEFVRERDLITLPEPLTVHTARSPAFFVGQSVGGVYPAGPYSPADAKTLFFLPTPREDMSAEQRESFFRDFNHHFNVMITPHEMVPGHYLQLKLAARHPRKIRALYGDGVYIEGWGTFCERLMLDQGWGGPADRLAHLKKQLENIARTIVDIRVHTEDLGRDEVIAFVEGEAFQEAQFASNMWSRSITSAPQITTYFLGYSQVMGLYDDVRAARGAAFDLKGFMDGMMALGPVPVAAYREVMLEGAR